MPEDRVAEEGLSVCVDVIRQVREIPGVAGVHVMAIGWEDAVPEILERAGLAREVPPLTPPAGVPAAEADPAGSGPRA